MLIDEAPDDAATLHEYAILEVTNKKERTQNNMQFLKALPNEEKGLLHVSHSVVLKHRTYTYNQISKFLI